jgi:L-serine dehydratase
VIPVDEVIDAMYRIGKSMPKSIRETATGGLATTPTGIALKEKIYSK